MSSPILSESMKVDELSCDFFLFGSQGTVYTIIHAARSPFDSHWTFLSSSLLGLCIHATLPHVHVCSFAPGSLLRS